MTVEIRQLTVTSWRDAARHIMKEGQALFETVGNGAIAVAYVPLEPRNGGGVMTGLWAPVLKFKKRGKHGLDMRYYYYLPPAGTYVQARNLVHEVARAESLGL